MTRKNTAHPNFFRSPRKGFVYVLSHPYMTCIKIGCSGNLPEYRAAQLSGTKGVPGHFRVAHAIVADDRFTVERIVKDEFADKHICKEFYDVPVEDVVRFIESTWPDAVPAAEAERKRMMTALESLRRPLYGRKTR